MKTRALASLLSVAVLCCSAYAATTAVPPLPQDPSLAECLKAAEKPWSESTLDFRKCLTLLQGVSTAIVEPSAHAQTRQFGLPEGGDLTGLQAIAAQCQAGQIRPGGLFGVSVESGSYPDACKRVYAAIAPRHQAWLRDKLAACAGAQRAPDCDQLELGQVAARLREFPGRDDQARLVAAAQACNQMSSADLANPNNKKACEYAFRVSSQRAAADEKAGVEAALNPGNRCNKPAPRGESTVSQTERERDCKLLRRYLGQGGAPENDSERGDMQARARGECNNTRRDESYRKRWCAVLYSILGEDQRHADLNRHKQNAPNIRNFLQCRERGGDCERPEGVRDEELNSACGNGKRFDRQQNKCVATAPAAPTAPLVTSSVPTTTCGGSGQRMCYRPTNGQPAGCGDGLMPYGRGDTCTAVDANTCRRVRVFAWNAITGKCQWNPCRNGRWDENQGKCVLRSVPTPG